MSDIGEVQSTQHAGPDSVALNITDLNIAGSDIEMDDSTETSTALDEAGDKQPLTSVKEVHSHENEPEKSGKKIKPCPVGAAAPPCDSPSPPPSSCGTDPPSPAHVDHSFSWDGLMRRPTFAATPVACFLHAPLSATWRNICAGLKVEVAERHAGRGAQPTFWVATVLQVQGYRGLVRPEGLGSDPSLDRWLELCSPDVKPVGWCAARGLPLTPPAAAGPAEDWQRILVRRLTGTRTLPAGFHRKVVAGLSSQLAVGQTVEVVDKSCISQVRAARVSHVVGRRLHVHYLDAPEDDGGFWCHENSPLVHPVGWARAVGHRLQASAAYKARCETGQFLDTDATEDCLPAPLPVTHEGFKVGMKLEALDPLNLGTIGVATVCQVLANHFMMVRLETSPDSDWFCYHAASPYIFPAGFCRTVGVPLTPPHGHTAETFTWEAYLAAEGGAAAAPAHLFHRPPLSHGFQPGQRLEAVDLMDPQLVCVATVAAVVGRLLRIHFDGWEEQFDQWADAESPDLFPVGWCRLVGYRLEPPRAAERPAPRRVQRRRASTRGRGRPRLRGRFGAGRSPRGARGGRAGAASAEGRAGSASVSPVGGESGSQRRPAEGDTETESLADDGASWRGSSQGGAGDAQEDLTPKLTPEPTPEPEPTPGPEVEQLEPQPEPEPEQSGPELETEAQNRPMEVGEPEADLESPAGRGAHADAAMEA